MNIEDFFNQTVMSINEFQEGSRKVSESLNLPMQEQAPPNNGGARVSFSHNDSAAILKVEDGALTDCFVLERKKEKVKFTNIQFDCETSSGEKFSGYVNLATGQYLIPLEHGTIHRYPPKEVQQQKNFVKDGTKIKKEAEEAVSDEFWSNKGFDRVQDKPAQQVDSSSLGNSGTYKGGFTADSVQSQIRGTIVPAVLPSFYQIVQQGIDELKANMDKINERLDKLEKASLSNSVGFGGVDIFQNLINSKKESDEKPTPKNEVNPQAIKTNGAATWTSNKPPAESVATPKVMIDGCGVNRADKPVPVSKEIEPKCQTWVRAINYPDGREFKLEAEIELDGDSTDDELINKLKEDGYKLAGATGSKGWAKNEHMNKYPPRPTINKRIVIKSVLEFCNKYGYTENNMPYDLVNCFSLTCHDENSGWKLARRLECNCKWNVSKEDEVKLDVLQDYVERAMGRVEKKWIDDNKILPPFPIGAVLRDGVIIRILGTGEGGNYEQRGYYKVLSVVDSKEVKTIVKFEDAVLSD